MMEIERKSIGQPYSLHDAKILEIEREGDDLLLKTQYGYADCETGEPVDGDVRIEGVSFDDCYAYVLNYGPALCGNPGKFKGRKMSLEDFLKGFKKNHTLDIMSEHDSFRTYYLDGFYNRGKFTCEFILSFYHTGSVRYIVK